MRQLTVVLFEREGALARMTTELADAGINLVNIDAEEIDSIGVVQLMVEEDDFAQAHEILRETGHQVMPQQALVVQIEDVAGGLAKLAVKLADAKVNVRSMRIVRREDGYCLAAIVPEPIDVARAVLAGNIIG